MMRSASVSRLGSEFDAFLFAPIGEDKNGMLLSVLSALARLDIDPWLEAANLAALSGTTATERLTSLIASLPNEPSTPRDSSKIAVRLVALLPRRPGLNVPPRKILLGSATAPNSRSVTQIITINVIFIAFVLGAQWIMASSRPPVRADDAHVRTAGTVTAKIPPSIPSRDRPVGFGQQEQP